MPDSNIFGGPAITSADIGEPWIEHSADEMYLGKVNIINHSGRINETISVFILKNIDFTNSHYFALKAKALAEINAHPLVKFRWKFHRAI